MTGQEALDNAVRILQVIEGDPNLEMVRVLNGVADSWLVVAQLLLVTETAD